MNTSLPELAHTRPHQGATPRRHWHPSWSHRRQVESSCLRIRSRPKRDCHRDETNRALPSARRWLEAV